MGPIYALQAEFQRFRVHNRYDHRMLFFLFDVGAFLFSALLLFSLTWGLWYSGVRVLDWMELRSTESTLGGTQFSENSQSLQNTVTITAGAEVSTADQVNTPVLQQSGAANSPEATASRTVQIEVPAVATEALVSNSADVASPTGNRADFYPPLQQEEWMLAQSSAALTVQLSSTTNLPFLQNFRSSLPPAQPAAIFHYKQHKSGRPEYGLAYGTFENAAQARRALAELSADSKRFVPWIRRIGTIQQQIRVQQQ